MKKWKNLFILGLVTLMTAIILVGCGSSDISQGVAKNDYPVTIQGVTLNSRPSGVAVLSENIADVIVTIGYEATLKAKSEDCTQRDLSVLPNITIDDVEEMEKLGVTLVLVDEDPTQQQKDALAQKGIQVLAIAPAKNREDCKRLYREVGSAMGGGNTGYTKGEKSCDNVFYTLDDITRLVPTSGGQSTACYIYDLEGRIATGDSLWGDLIGYAGFFNIFGDGVNGRLEDVRFMRTANPYYIFCPAGLKEQLEKTEIFKDLDAVKNGRVFELDPSAMERQGRTMLDTVTDMVRMVYPELFITKQSDSSMTSDTSSETTSSETTSSTSSAATVISKPEVVAQAGTLQYGNSGEAVRCMQERLDELGYMYAAVNGIFDDATLRAVKDFQYLHNFSTTGIATQELLDVLFSDEASLRT